MANPTRNVFEINVSLNYVTPPIWRRLLVAPGTNLGDLHLIIQIAMGWTDSHLHQFIDGNNFYGVPDPAFGSEVSDESGIPIGSLLKEDGDSILYEYDFGDGWVHTVTLERIRPQQPGEAVPACLAGERSCPPEDVGGPFGYVEFLQAFADKTHPDHDEMVDWAGEYFDPERFDLDAVSKMLTVR
ncbi:MAG: plasmid pRiA4b ORF-3 family protein [Rhodothermia bacterium]